MPDELDRESATDLLKNLRELTDVTSLKAGQEQYRTITSHIESLQQIVAKSDSEVTQKLAEITPLVRTQLAEWKREEQRIIDQIEVKRTELAEQGIQLDLAYVRKLAHDEASHDRSLKNLRAWRPHLNTLREERIELLEQLWAVRKSIFAARFKFARTATAAMKGTLHDVEVTVKLDEGAWSPDAEKIVQQVMGWKTVQVPRAALLVQSLTVRQLLGCIQRNDTKTINMIETREGTQVFSRADSEDIIARLREPATRFALERCSVEDLPRISVTKRMESGGETKFVSREFARLSLGQQQSVLLALMLSADTSAPLLIDQPEDNLDSEFIYSSIVPVLRRAKERRQVIIVTHNPNITVLGDAELILSLKAFSDHGQILQRGSIDNEDTRRMCCQILEGGEHAFRRRARVYGVL